MYVFKYLAAAFAAGLLATVSVGTLAFSSSHPIKDAGATVSAAKADSTNHGDYVSVAPGIMVDFVTYAGDYVVTKPARTELEKIFGGPVDYGKTLRAVQKAVAKQGVVVKHIVCKEYVDAPKVDGADDFGKATTYISHCQFITTSVEAAFDRLTGYAEGSYKETVKTVRAEREAKAEDGVSGNVIAYGVPASVEG